MPSDDDDDLPGDDKLTAMRAVWLSMRDEEPSDKGLAALMAAARDKADTMKDAEAAPRESWWQKVLAVLRRPPVLALASVTLLLGGALVIANRGENAVVDERAASPAVAPAASKAEDTGAAQPDRWSAGSAAAEPMTPPATVEPEAVTSELKAAEPEQPATAKPASPPARRPARSPAPERRSAPERSPAPERTTANEALDQREVGTTAPSPEPTPTSDQRDEAAPAPVTRGAQTRPASPAAPPPPSPGALGAGGEATVDAVQEKDDGDRGRDPALVQRLVKQCESAAARGDCAAVKALAARIRSEDAPTYRARVVKNASIARCLE